MKLTRRNSSLAGGVFHCDDAAALGRGGEPLVQHGDQGVLFGPALQLPDSEAHEGRHRQQRENGETGDRRPPRQGTGDFGSRWISRPAPPCDELQRDRSDFIERSGSSVVAMISGGHSAACSRNGGWYLISTIRAAVTTMAPASMMMKIEGPSPASMKA